MCRVEDITVEGLVKGSVIHFHRARTIVVSSSGTISASGMGIPSFFCPEEKSYVLVLLHTL